MAAGVRRSRSGRMSPAAGSSPRRSPRASRSKRCGASRPAALRPSLPRGARAAAGRSRPGRRRSRPGGASLVALAELARSCTDPGDRLCLAPHPWPRTSGPCLRTGSCHELGCAMTAVATAGRGDLGQKGNWPGGKDEAAAARAAAAAQLQDAAARYHDYVAAVVLAAASGFVAYSAGVRQAAGGWTSTTSWAVPATSVAGDCSRRTQAAGPRAPFAAALPLPPRRRVPGHRSAAGRDRPVPLRARAAGAAIGARWSSSRASSSSSATPSSPSTASAAPTSPLRPGQAARLDQPDAAGAVPVITQNFRDDARRSSSGSTGPSTACLGARRGGRPPAPLRACRRRTGGRATDPRVSVLLAGSTRSRAAESDAARRDEAAALAALLVEMQQPDGGRWAVQDRDAPTAARDAPRAALGRHRLLVRHDHRPRDVRAGAARRRCAVSGRWRQDLLRSDARSPTRCSACARSDDPATRRPSTAPCTRPTSASATTVPSSPGRTAGSSTCSHPSSRRATRL